MCDAQGIKKNVEASVLEVSAIVTPDVLDLDAIIRRGLICEASEDILHFSLIENYVYPGVSRVIINNSEAIEMCSSNKGRVVSRAK